MIQPAFWPAVRQAVALWRERTFARGDPPPDVWAEALRAAQLADIVALIELPADSALAQRELVIATAMIALGPETAGDPPPGMWCILCELVQHEVGSGDAEQWFEVVLAWGCGWRRHVQATTGIWEGEWQGAVLTFCAMVLGSVRKTLTLVLDLLAYTYTCDVRHGIQRLHGTAATRHLNHMLVAEETLDPLAAAGEPGLYAAEIALELIRGTAARAETAGARPAHVLTNWQPHERRLRVFVAEAVRGSASPVLKGGAFEQSMLYPRLMEDFGLRVGQVAFKVCHAPECNGALIQHSVTTGTPLQLRDITRGLYEGARCTACGTPAHAQKTYHLARRHWLFVPANYGGNYVLWHVWRCTRCGTLFPCSPPYRHIQERIKNLESYIQEFQQAQPAPASACASVAYADGQPAAPRLLQRARRELQHLHTQRKLVAADIACPLCRQTGPPQRPTLVWTYTSSDTIDFDSYNGEQIR